MKLKQTLAKMLTEYHPLPGSTFYQKMKHAPWNKKVTMQPNRPTRFIPQVWQVAAMLLIVIALLSLSIPSVRASLSAWFGLSVAPSNQMPAAPVTLAAVTPAVVTAPTAIVAMSQPTTALTEPAAAETSVPAPSTVPVEKPAQISDLSSQTGWEVLVPAYLPEGYHFQSAYYDINHQMVIVTYLVTRTLPGSSDPALTASKTITLLQALKNDFVPMQTALGANVEDIQVNGQPAAYAVGAWDSEFVKDDQDSNGGKMVSTWRNDLAMQNAYWQVENVYLVLMTEDEAVSKAELVQMAENTGK